MPSVSGLFLSQSSSSPTAGAILATPVVQVRKADLRQVQLSSQETDLKPSLSNGRAQRLFLTVLEAGNSADSVPGEGRFLVCRQLSPPMSSRGISLVPFSKSINSVMRAPPSWPNLPLITFQRPYLQIPSPWGLRLQHKNFEGLQTFSPCIV